MCLRQGRFHNKFNLQELVDAHMGSITRQDLKTILLFGVHIAKIDDDFAPFEKKILKRFSDEMGLTEEERIDLIVQEVSLGKGLMSLSSDSAKHLLVKTLCAVSFVDGAADKTELDFIEKVINTIGGAFFFV